MKKISKDKPVPIYYQLKEILKEMINNNVLRAGEKIPTERELCEIHDISRMTARRAVNELVNEGLLYREQGRGTFVEEAEAKFKQQLSELHGFTEEMQNKDFETESKILSFTIKEVTKEIREHLQSEKAIAIKRLRIVDDVPLAIENVWVPCELCPDLTEDVLAGSSLYNIFEERYNYQLDHARQTIEPTVLTNEESDLLSLPKESLALLFRRTTYLSNDDIIEYTKSIYRSDEYKYEVLLE
ncbi:GntR family transcriptional regulator [Halanaerobacter jeridensis]|uniref:GntR family transcriptional regulator n=1 Tax=Halanaerobacter jeridensis TaxID=706427 RepID=A0A939BNR8_9FIRM|nr:GntR family transcriptional regulator [Halanaerobacter jeridensis]MBM7555952.1 GntR family transcriptional regulator [Halanaerobacter jeridensis]